MSRTPNSKLLRVADTMSGGSVVDPLSLADCKKFLRLPSAFTQDDDLITDLITAAKLECETMVSRSWVNTTWQLTLDYFPPYSSRWGSLLPPALVGPWSDRNYWLNLSDNAIQLPMPPLVSVTSVTYVDVNGTLQTMNLAPSAQQVQIVTGTPGQLTPFFGRMFPPTQPTLGAVNITFVAGYGADPTAVAFPRTLKLAMQYLVTKYYNYRSSDVDTPNQVNRLMDSLNWGQYGG